ncbi:MAG: DUF1634 domain-containing protein [Acidobacteriaceae bacterium]|nr:DUF1634 domain-containing protein [Acidobacteriaceae bacterium]
MKRLNDQEVEQIIGNLLRAGVILAALIVAVGGSVFLYRHAHEIPEHSVFRGEPKTLDTLGGVFSRATLETGRGLIMAGLLVLILTPIARVAFSLAAFALQRDWLYFGITGIVLALLLYSLFLS